MRGNASHWKVLDDPKVQRVARNVARHTAENNKGFLDADDLYQESLLLIAGKPDLSEHAIVGDYGLLYNALRMDLLDKFVRPLLRSGEMEQRKYKTVSTEEADEYAAPVVMFNDGTGEYTDEAVKLLLPAVWDEAYAYGLPDREDSPERDMPKAAANKARSNNHWAYIADIKTGWDKTPLTLSERRATLLYYGIGWTQTDIAKYEGVSQKQVSVRLNSAVSKITARLNGASLNSEEETEID